MKVLRLTAEGSSIAIPEWFKEEQRYAFFHGKAPTSSAGEASSYAYVLRMSKKSFPAEESYDWQRMEYDLMLGHPRQSDEFNNPIYVVRRSFAAGRDGNCLCLLDMLPDDGEAIIFRWNQEVTILGRGIKRRAERPRNRNTRRALEIEYPVLLCAPGADFEWNQNHQDYRAKWDGAAFHVATPQLPVMPVRIEPFERLYAYR